MKSKTNTSRLTADTLHGIWAGVTMSWDSAYRFDEKSYAANLHRVTEADVHGVYTTGSTGEFYCLEFEEFCAMVDLAVAACARQGTPLQIGCCSDDTAKTIKLLQYAAGKKAVGAAQVVIPYWMELTDRELLQFFKDLHTACPDLPLVHYNIPRTKRFLHGEDYLRILEVAPNLIGVKYTFAGSHWGQLQQALQLTPQLSYFVGEGLLASAMQLGARGSYSSLVCAQPSYMLAMYAHATNGRWDEAFKMQRQIVQAFGEAEKFIESRGEGTIDPVFDKGMAVASGFFVGHQRCRPPYIGWSDETIVAFRDWLTRNYPEFTYQGK
jgi:dihydrodipicolinate synthase/N-acetylneuraminate lyase